MAARDDILGRIRRTQGAAGDRDAAVAERLATHPRGPQLARVALPRRELIDLFAAKATASSATIDRVTDPVAVPAMVADYLARENLPAEIVMAPDADLDIVPWQARPLLSIRRGRPLDTELVSLTGAFAGIAETGTLMLLSGPHSPTTLNLLPDTHIVLLRQRQIVGAFEDAWDRVRMLGRPTLPRTVNFITGPSRSADIGQQLQMGAHGPRRLHIVLVDDER